MHGGLHQSRLRRKSYGVVWSTTTTDDDVDTGRLPDLCCHFSGKRVHVLALNPFAAKRHSCDAKDTIFTGWAIAGVQRREDEHNSRLNFAYGWCEQLCDAGEDDDADDECRICDYNITHILRTTKKRPLAIYYTIRKNIVARNAAHTHT